MDASANQVTTAYTWGADGLVSDHAGTQSRFYLFDALGNARSLLDPNGNLMASAAYTAYGTPVGAPLPSTPFGWQGQAGCYSDAETGLVFMEARYYSPALGRFVSRDPIGFDGGINLYAYCGGDPVNFGDPNGTTVLVICGGNHKDPGYFYQHAEAYVTYNKCFGNIPISEPVVIRSSHTVGDMEYWLSHTKNITCIYYFGHAGNDSLYLGHDTYDRNLSLMRVSQLPNGPNMRNLKYICLFGCETGDRGRRKKINMAQAFANRYHVPVEGVNGKLSLGYPLLEDKNHNARFDPFPWMLRPTKGLQWYIPNGTTPDMYYHSNLVTIYPWDLPDER